MAFQTNKTSTFNKNNQQQRAVAEGPKNISISGLYEGKPDSKLALKGSTLKEDLVIPAGYSIKVFMKGGKSKNGKDLPPFEVVATPPRTSK